MVEECTQVARIICGECGEGSVVVVHFRIPISLFPYEVDLPELELQFVNTDVVKLELDNVEVVKLELDNLEVNNLEEDNQEPSGIKVVNLEVVNLEAVDPAAIDLEGINLEAINLEAVNQEAVDLHAVDLEAHQQNVKWRASHNSMTQLIWTATPILPEDPRRSQKLPNMLNAKQCASQVLLNAPDIADQNTRIF